MSKREVEHLTKHYVRFLIPGTIVANSSERECRPGEVPEWPDSAYAYERWQRTDVEVGGKMYRGEAFKVGRTIYHPDSRVETLAQVRRNPEATDVLIANMECNGWDQIIWSRWGNWPQPFDAAEMEIAE